MCASNFEFRISKQADERRKSHAAHKMRSTQANRSPIGSNLRLADRWPFGAIEACELQWLRNWLRRSAALASSFADLEQRYLSKLCVLPDCVGSRSFDSATRLLSEVAIQEPVEFNRRKLGYKHTNDERDTRRIREQRPASSPSSPSLGSLRARARKSQRQPSHV